jgi:Spy/CpxP family protein refolding chaperone
MMMRAYIISIALTVAAIGAVAPAAFAQQAPPPGQYDDLVGPENQPGRGNALSEEKREEIRKKIETVRIWRLTEQLKLDTTASAKLASLMSSVDQQRRSIIQEQMMGMRELRITLKSQKPDEGQIKSLLDKMESNQRAQQELREREWKGLRDILTVEQQARFLLFQQEFRREMQRMISNARGGNRGRGPMAGQRRGNTPGGQVPPEEEQ